MKALPIKALPLAAVALLCTSLTATAEDFSSVEEKMTGKEFMAAGLDKLSDEELASLNAWLRDNVGTASADTSVQPTQRAEDNIGFKQDSGERGTVRSTIVGEFRGWSGGTVFELANGQVWRQTNSSDFGYTGEQPAQVTIEPGLLGSWRLRVEGYNASVRVERVR